MNATLKEKSVTINGARMCYTDSESGVDPIIFIHGFPFDKSTWKNQSDFFGANYRVITYDIRGFGKSTGGDKPFSIELFADDLTGLMDELKISSAIVCGLSMGGYILLNAINRFPERFRSVILSDTQCNGDTDEGKVKRYQTIQSIERDGLKSFAEGFVKNIFCQETLINKSEIAERIVEVINQTKATSVTSALKALAERDETCSTLDRINVPVLIICGKEDVITPPSKSEYMNSRIQGSQFKLVENAGHMSNLENPEQFNLVLDDFLTKVSRGAFPQEQI